MYCQLINGSDMVGDFLDSCPNVRSLSIVDNLGEWTSAFGNQLQKLEVATNKPTGAIPKSCLSSLEFNLYEDELKIMRQHWKHLKHIDMVSVITDNARLIEFITSYG